MSLLVALLAVGFASSGITFVVRAAVPQLWLLAKPFSCDLCMSFWSSLAVTAWLARSGDVGPEQSVVACCGGIGVAVLMVRTANRVAT